jgi:invasion protein IalB
MNKNKIRIRGIILAAIVVIAGAAVMMLSSEDKVSMVGKAEANKPPQLWFSRCNKASEDAKEYCEIYQRLVVKETNQRMVEFALGYPEGSQTARGVIILPLGIVLPKNLEVQIDDGELMKAQIHYCMRGGCFALLNLDDTTINMLKKGNEMTLAFYAMGGKRIAVKISLQGFTKALKGVS